MKRTAALVALLLAATGLIAGSASATRSAPVAADRLQALEQGILTRLNATRASRGLKPLALSGDLQNAALAHSRSMLDNGFFEHDSKDGSPFFERVKKYYKAAGYAGWSAGENLLYNSGEMDAASAIEAWLDSPAHRENMLAPGWREVGIGALHAAAAGGTFGGDATWVITMDFGLRTGGTDRAAVTPGKAAKTTKAAKAKAAAKKARAAQLRAKNRAADLAHQKQAKVVTPVRPSTPVKQTVERALPTPTDDDADDTMLDVDTTSADEAAENDGLADEAADEFDFGFGLDELGLSGLGGIGVAGNDEDGAAGGDADPLLQA